MTWRTERFQSASRNPQAAIVHVVPHLEYPPGSGRIRGLRSPHPSSGCSAPTLPCERRAHPCAKASMRETRTTCSSSTRWRSICRRMKPASRCWRGERGRAAKRWNASPTSCSSCRRRARRPLPARPVVVGSGPGGLAAGLFPGRAGLSAARAGTRPAVRERIRDVHAFDAGGALNPESNYLFGEGGAGTFSDGKLTCRGSRARRAPRAGTVRRVQGQAVDPLRPSAAPGQQSPAGRGQGDPPAHRGAGRRGPLLLPGRGPRPRRRPAARRCAPRPAIIPADVAMLAIGHSARDTYADAAAPRRADGAEAVPDGRAHRAAAGDGQPRAVRPTPARRQARLGGLLAGRPRPARSVHLLHVCRRLRHSQRLGGRLLLHQRHEPVEARFAVRQQRPGGDRCLSRQFGGTDVLAGVRLQQHYEQQGLRAGPGRVPLSDPAGRAISCAIARRGAAAGVQLSARPGGARDWRSWCRRWSSRRCITACRSWIAAGTAASWPRRRWSARKSRGSSPVRIVRDDADRESPGIDGLYPVGEGPATPAASSAPPWMGCAPPGDRRQVCTPGCLVTRPPGSNKGSGRPTISN